MSNPASIEAGRSMCGIIAFVKSRVVGRFELSDEDVPGKASRMPADAQRVYMVTATTMSASRRVAATASAIARPCRVLLDSARNGNSSCRPRT